VIYLGLATIVSRQCAHGYYFQEEDCVYRSNRIGQLNTELQTIGFTDNPNPNPQALFFFLERVLEEEPGTIVLISA
jgi:hypothetical protein